MAEEIEFSQQVFEHRVDTSRAGDTGLGALSSALRTGIRAGTQIVKAFEQKELRETLDLLSNPTATVEEIQEIENEATFPLTKIRARNRRGNVIVGQRMEEIQKRISEMPDAVSARRELRVIQQEIMGLETDASVQAGMRERFASMAPSLFADASKRRQQAEVERERLDVGADLVAAVEIGPEMFAETYADLLSDQQLSGGDTDQFAGDALDGLQAHWLEGISAEGNEANFHSTEVLASIDALVENVPMPKHQEKQFLALRKTILTADEARRKSNPVLLAAADKQRGIDIQVAIARFRERNPGADFPVWLVDAYWNTAASRGDARSTQQWLDDNAAAPGVVAMPAFTEASKALEATLRDVTGDEWIMEAAIATAAMENYREEALLIDPGQDDEVIRQQLSRLREGATARAKQYRDGQMLAEAEFVKDNISVFGDVAAFTAAGDHVNARKLEVRFNIDKKQAGYKFRKQAQIRTAHDLGIDIEWDVVDLNL